VGLCGILGDQLGDIIRDRGNPLGDVLGCGRCGPASVCVQLAAHQVGHQAADQRLDLGEGGRSAWWFAWWFVAAVTAARRRRRAARSRLRRAALSTLGPARADAACERGIGPSERGIGSMHSPMHSPMRSLTYIRQPKGGGRQQLDVAARQARRFCNKRILSRLKGRHLTTGHGQAVAEGFDSDLRSQVAIGRLRHLFIGLTTEGCIRLG
jgi:hypothetical protein